jgi:hypothetical protein
MSLKEMEAEYISKKAEENKDSSKEEAVTEDARPF